MSFEIPKEVENLKQELVKKFKDDVIPVVCNNCGDHTVMNKMYADILKNGIDSCGKCRK